MKKMRFRSALLSFAVLVLAWGGVISCSNNDDDDKVVETVSLVEKIASATDGDVIALNNLVTVETGATIVVDKAITLTGSNARKLYDAKNAKITVKTTGIKLINIKNIEEVIVAETVGDGDFTIENCESEKVTVKGGGANSVHFVGAKVAVVDAVHTGVRIVLEALCHIFSVNVQENCHIEAPSTQSYVENVIVDKTVEEVKLSGKPSITTLITNSDADVQPTILIASNNVEISKAADKADDGTVSEIVVAVTDESIAEPFYETLTENEVAEAETAAENATIADVVETTADATDTTTPVALPDRDNDGVLTLRNSAYGVLVKVDTASYPKVNQVNFYRAEYGTEKWYYIGTYQSRSGVPLVGAVSYTDYYVEKDKAYSYYANLITGQNNNVAHISEKDTITATKGRGILELPETITINYNKDDFTFESQGSRTIANFGDEKTADNLTVYFKPVGEETTTTIMESTVYTYLGFSGGYATLQFVKPEHIGVPLELVGAKVNIRVDKNDVRCVWVSIPTEAVGGTGFTSGKVTFAQEDLPIKIEDATQGVTITADTSKLSGYGKTVNRIDLGINHDYASEMYYIRNPKGDSVALSGSTYVFTHKTLKPDAKDRFTFQFKTYNTTEKKTETFVTVGMYYTPKTGSGNLSLSEDVKVANYNPYSQVAYLNKSPDAWLVDESGAFTSLPSSIEVSVDGEAKTLSSSGYSATVKMKDKNFATDVSVSSGYFNATIADNKVYAYVMNFARQKNLWEKTVSPYRSQISSNYRDGSSNDTSSYRIDYYPYDSKSYVIPGLDEKLTITDKFSGKTFKLASGGTITFPAESATSTSSSLADGTVTIVKDEVTTSGTVKYSTNRIEVVDNTKKQTYQFALLDANTVVLCKDVFGRNDTGTDFSGSKWQNNAGTQTYEFKADKTYAYTKDGEVKESGTWVQQTGDTVTLTPTGEGATAKTFVYSVTLLSTSPY